jgi:hypothetical protein
MLPQLGLGCFQLMTFMTVPALLFLPYCVLWTVQALPGS